MSEGKKRGGFAHMKANNPDRFKSVSSAGGKNREPSRRSFSIDPQLAKEASKKGVEAKKRLQRGDKPLA